MEHVTAQLQRIYGSRAWIIAPEIVQAATGQVDALHALGADELLVLAGSRGTGPEPAGVETIVLGIAADSLMAAIHAFDAALTSLPAEAAAALDEFDPAHRAQVIASPFCQQPTVAGRAVWGSRPPHWRALEDKTVVDALWRDADVPHAPSAIVPADARRLAAVATALDVGDGTVWVADNRRGWHGGATGLRWVRTPDQAADAAAFMAESAETVRVMPFLEGVPCSIHGMVLPDATVAFRPCEMVVLRRAGRSELCYAGMSTMWDPPAADRGALRAIARRVGARLRSTVGYRGAFSIDGVMTADGFRPTEINPRYSAAMGLLAASVALPLDLLHFAAVEGVDVDWRPTDLEHEVVTAADDTRQARCHVVVNCSLDTGVIDLRRDDGRMRQVSHGPVDATLHCGPSAIGGFVRVAIGDDAVATGSSVAPLVVEALAWADAELGLGLGALEAPADVRGDIDELRRSEGAGPAQS